MGPAIRGANSGQHSAKVADGLRSLGCERGDRIVIVCGNRIEFLGAFFGTTFGGYIPVPLHTALQGDMLSFLFRDSAPSAVICESPYLEACRRAAAEAPIEPRFLVVGAAEGALPAGCLSYTDVVERSSATGPVASSYHDLATILYTSGTTGPSKGVMVTQRMALGFSNSIDWVLAHEPTDILFSTLPLFHANALLLTFVGASRCGGSAVPAPRFETRRVSGRKSESRKRPSSPCSAR